MFSPHMFSKAARNFMMTRRSRPFAGPTRALALATLTAGLALALPAPAAWAVHMPKVPELSASALTPFTQSDSQIWDAVVPLPDGRMLFEAPAWIGNPGPQLSIRTADGRFTPYPNAEWNAATGDAAKRIVAAAGLTLLPDGTLWVLDSGVPDRKAPAVAPPKLIHIDTRTNTVLGTVAIEKSALHPQSILSGVAVHGTTAYVADSGVAGVLVVDLPSASTRRFLDRHPALIATRPIQIPGGTLNWADGHAAAIDSSMIAISPDGRWIVLQAPGNYLARVDTSTFSDPDITPAAMEEIVTQWYKTPSLGGMTIGPDGTLYWSDVSTGSILSYSTGRIPRRLITDPRLKYPGTPGLDMHGHLFVPTLQLDHSAAFQNGHATVTWPVTVYQLTLPTTPPPP